MVDNSAALQELDHVMGDWGYTMNATDYVDSVANMRSIATARPAGRGRGIGCVQLPHKSPQDVRLAAQLNQLNAHDVPLAHLPTTRETLSRNPEAEITATIRSLGIYGTDGQLDAARTRRTVLDGEDIRVDGKVPVILNGEYFRARYQDADDSQPQRSSPIIPYDPMLPLPVQFTTIPEFQAKADARGPKGKPKSKQPQPTPTPTAGGKGKKTKWTKVPFEALVPAARPRGRYDQDHPIGPGVCTSKFARNVIGSDGPKALY